MFTRRVLATVVAVMVMTNAIPPAWTASQPVPPAHARLAAAVSEGAKVTQPEMIVQFALPEHLSDERVREWLASGMREGWSDTIDRLVASFAGVGSN